MEFNFDPASVPKSERSFEPLPAGWYVAQVTDSSINELKSSPGRGLRLRLDVLSDSHRGRVIWWHLNVQHTKADVERISQQQLRELCDAVGVTRLTDTTQLHNRPLNVKVKIRPDDSGVHGPRNEVVGVRALGAATAPASASRGFPAAPPRTVPPVAPPQASSPPAPSAPPVQAPVAAQPPAPEAPQPAGASQTPPWARRAA